MSLYPISREISKLQPGQRLDVDCEVLRRVFPPMPLVGFGGPTWTPAERAMENILGSAYEFRFWENRHDGTITFERLKEPLRDGLRTYVSPDRRRHFQQRPDGFYEPIPEPAAPPA